MKIRSRSMLLLATSVLVAVCCSSCDYKTWKKYKAAEAISAKEKDAILHGIETIPHARQFHGLYPKAYWSISRFGGKPGDQSMRAQILLYDRHYFTLRMKVDIDPRLPKIIAHSEPSFIFEEVSVADIAHNGNYHFSYNSGNGHTLTEKQWLQLVTANGDFSAIGITVITNQPLKLLRKHWNENKPKYSP